MNTWIQVYAQNLKSTCKSKVCGIINEQEYGRVTGGNEKVGVRNAM